MSKTRLLLYGAYGYTGRLTAELAAAKKLDVVLAGRNKAALALLFPWPSAPCTIRARCACLRCAPRFTSSTSELAHPLRAVHRGAQQPDDAGVDVQEAPAKPRAGGADVDCGDDIRRSALESAYRPNRNTEQKAVRELDKDVTRVGCVPRGYRTKPGPPRTRFPGASGRDLSEDCGITHSLRARLHQSRWFRHASPSIPSVTWSRAFRRGSPPLPHPRRACDTRPRPSAVQA